MSTSATSLNRVAGQACEATRDLIHRTRRESSELNTPADVAELLATLCELTGVLPQLLTQLGSWVDHHAPQLLVDTESPQSLEQTLTALREAIAEASQHQGRAAQSIGVAQQHAAHIMLSSTGPRPGVEVSESALPTTVSHPELAGNVVVRGARQPAQDDTPSTHSSAAERL